MSNDKNAKNLNEFELETSPRVHRSRYGSSLIFQIYFDEFSKENLDPGFSPLLNKSNSPFFESAVIADLIQGGFHENADFFGVFSWKFKIKFGITSAHVRLKMEEDRYSADVYSIPFNETAPSVWTQDMRPDSGSAHLRKIGTALFSRMGYDINLETLETPHIHMNAFVARSELYKAFADEFLIPALKVMSEPDPELAALLNKHAFYEAEFKHPKLLSRLKSIFGKSQFMFHPFVGERLFPTWLALRVPIKKPKIVEFDVYRAPQGVIAGN